MTVHPDEAMAVAVARLPPPSPCKTPPPLDQPLPLPQLAVMDELAPEAAARAPQAGAAAAVAGAVEVVAQQGGPPAAQGQQAERRDGGGSSQAHDIAALMQVRVLLAEWQAARAAGWLPAPWRAARAACCLASTLPQLLRLALGAAGVLVMHQRCCPQATAKPLQCTVHVVLSLREATAARLKPGRLMAVVMRAPVCCGRPLSCRFSANLSCRRSDLTWWSERWPWGPLTRSKTFAPRRRPSSERREFLSCSFWSMYGGGAEVLAWGCRGVAVPRRGGPTSAEVSLRQRQPKCLLSVLCGREGFGVCCLFGIPASGPCAACTMPATFGWHGARHWRAHHWTILAPQQARLLHVPCILGGEWAFMIGIRP